MFCGNCGARLSPGDVFCASCGSPVSAAPVAPTDITVPFDANAAAATTMEMPPVAYSPPSGEQYAPAAPVRSSSKVPILVAVAIVVAAAAGVVGWWFVSSPGWNGGGIPPVKTTGNGGGTSTGATGTPTGTVQPPTEETTTPLPGGASATALSDPDSYDALISEWETITSMRAAFGEKLPGASKGTGWIYDTWSRLIGNKGDRQARVNLADEAASWQNRIETAAATFSALKISPAYQPYQADLMAIYNLLSERAWVYASTSDYAIDHPTVSKGNEPWRAVQEGKTGNLRAASDILSDLQHAIAEYVPPEAP